MKNLNFDALKFVLIADYFDKVAITNKVVRKMKLTTCHFVSIKKKKTFKK